MIEITNLSKKYDRDVLKSISLSLPRYGLVFINGPSGCGKTTLLNCISGLVPYDGSISVDGLCLERLSEKDMDLYRLKNIGFIFQDYKLFESDTVENNVLFPLEIGSNLSDFKKDRKIDDLLILVDLHSFKKRNINTLSGGQKQRVGIARALANDAKIILADEPTGALDENNGNEVMRILKIISQKTLVIVVSHDIELSRKYGDIILEMKDGEIVSRQYIYHDSDTHTLSLIKNGYSYKKPAIPMFFLLKHTLNKIKERPWRSVFCNLVTSLGLIGIGLALTLSKTVSENIKSVCNSIIDEDRITIVKKEANQTAITLEGASYDEARAYAKKYPENIHDVGYIYPNNFDSIFVDSNLFAVKGLYDEKILYGYNASTINEFDWLDLNNEAVYPKKPDELNDDEIVISLNMNDIREICFSLQIFRTVESLSEYLESSPLYIKFRTANYSWEYIDEHLFTIKGFILNTDKRIYHYNHLWNKVIFEDEMRLPTNNILYVNDDYPWTLKRIPYVECLNNKDYLIKSFEYDSEFDDYLLEIASYIYFPNHYEVDTSCKDINKLLFFIDTRNALNVRYVDLLSDDYQTLSDPIYGSNNGYLIYPEGLMMGFSNYFFVSSSEEILNQTINIHSTLSDDDVSSFEVGENTALGHFSRISNGLKFKPLDNKKMNGEKPNGFSEIVISSELAKKLNLNNPIGNQIFVAYVNKEIYLDNATTLRDYSTDTLKIVGIIEDDELCLYHEPDWSILYFQTRLGISSFSLGISCISFIDSSDDISNDISKINEKYFMLNVSNPSDGITDGIEDVCKYIEIAISAFSVIAVIISLILLSTCNYLHLNESKKDIGLSRCIGVSKKESNKFLYTHSVLMCMFSFILSSIENVIISLFISKGLGNYFGVSSSFIFEPMSILVMFALAFLISILSSWFVSVFVKKMTPLECLNS